MANRSAIRSDSRIDLAVGSGDTVQFTDDELNRAVDQVTADFSRLIPREQVYEITVDYEVTDEAFTSSFGTAVDLGNKPIEWNSETVKQAAVSYVRDTDYTMDYANGTITVLSTGSMADSTASTISYNKSRLAIDLASLTDLVVPHRVEWSVGSVPQQEAGWRIFAGILWITAPGHQSQQKASDKDHIRIEYHSQHTAPTDSVDGTFPRFLDDVMVKGVVAYALFIKHREQTLAAAMDDDNARGALASMIAVLAKGDVALDALTIASTGPHAKIVAALGNITTPLADINTALDAAITAIGRGTSALQKVATHTGGEADTALDTIQTHVNAADTALAKVDTYAGDATDGARKSLADAAAHETAAVAALAKVATHSGVDAKAALNNMEVHLTGVADSAFAALGDVDAQVALAKTALDKVTTHLEGASDSSLKALKDILTKTVFADADAALDEIATYLDLAHSGAGDTGAIKDAEGVWADQVKHILTAAGIPNAEDFLETGDDLINAVNLGDRAPEIYGAFADFALAMAQQWAGKRRDFLAIADRHQVQAATYISEAQGRMSQADRLIAESAEWARIAEGLVSEAAQRNVSAMADIREAVERVNIALAFSSQAQGMSAISDDFIAEAAGRMDIFDAHVAEANSRLGISDAYVAEGRARLGQAEAMLAEAAGRNAMSQAFIDEAATQVASAQAHISEAAGRAANVRLYFDEADRWVAKGQLYLAEAVQRIDESRVYAERSIAYTRIAAQRMDVADRLLSDARDRHGDYWNVLSSRAQQGRQSSQVSTRQYASREPTTETLAKLESS